MRTEPDRAIPFEILSSVSTFREMAPMERKMLSCETGPYSLTEEVEEEEDEGCMNAIIEEGSEDSVDNGEYR